MSKVYIIIVTYNGLKWIEKCLISTQLSTLTPEVIVIDNGSNDGTAALIESKFPSVRFIKSAENLGFGRANNIGMKLALEERADYAFLLNQDAYLETDTLQKMIDTHIRNPEYGVLSPMQMNGNGTIRDANFNFLINDRKNYYSASKFDDIKDLPEVFEVKFVMAALWLISIDCLRKVGLFDPIFFHYGEDHDFLNRVRYFKYKVGIVTDTISYHDREQRVITKNKQQKMMYFAVLVDVTNINNSFISAASKAIWFHVKLTLANAVHFRTRLVVEQQKDFYTLLRKTLEVLQARVKNRKM